LDRTGKEVELR